MALPETMLLEVFSWSPDSATAAALLATSRAGHQLRRDLTATALLLLRCHPCEFHNALRACSAGCPGGARAVVRRVVQLLGVDAERGGPHVASALLLQAMLFSSCEAGDDDAVQKLLALPVHPDIQAGNNRALRSTLTRGRHLGAQQSLLAAGADPCARKCEFFYLAGRMGGLAAVQELLHRCPAAALALATAKALHGAITCGDAEVIAYLLPLPRDPLPVHEYPTPEHQVSLAARAGRADALQLVLAHIATFPEELDAALNTAAKHSRAACAEVLMDWGAVVSSNTLGWVFEQRRRSSDKAREQQRWETFQLLLQRGAIVTPAVRNAARTAGCSHWLEAV